ncbi:MAG: hypothetical protein A2901_05085 [Elusimicrobia bacterium RIFCSPLOWO2_01_FULL_54_10]|nr:MAG: hypothetical protein A2901_05085 [Elusimicrobia bacterium RIFCSPLOWO2_01_FULL_54_10]
MSKITKYLLIASGICLLLLLAGVLTVKKMFPPEKIRTLITVKASQSLSREVRLGKIQAGLFKGVQIDDFAVSERPTFKEGTFIEAKAFVLKFNIWALLRKKVVIDQVLIDTPKISVVQYADGKTFNFSDLLQAKPAEKAEKPKAETPAESAPMSVTVTRAQIVGGRVSFVDISPRKIRLTLDPVDLTVKAADMTKPISVDLKVKAQGALQGKEVQAGLALKCVLELLGSRVNIESLAVDLPELDINASGSVTNFLNPDLNPEVNLSLSIANFNFESIGRWTEIPKGISFPPSSSITATLKGGLKSLNYDLVLKLLTMEAAVSGNAKNLTAESPTVKLTVKTNSFDLAGFAGLVEAAKPYQVMGKASLEAKAEGKVNALAYSAALTLENISAKYDKYAIDKIGASAKISANQIEIPKLTGRLGMQGKESSDFEIISTVKDFSNPDITLDANFNTLDLGMFVSDAKKGEPAKPASAFQSAKTAPYKGPVMKCRGSVKIAKVLYPKFEGQNAQADWKLTGITPVLDKLDGTAKFEMKDGKIKNIPLLASIAPILRTDPSALAFTRMGGTMNFAKGTAKTDDFKINSPAADITAQGTVYLPTSIPDMVLTAKLPKGSLGGTLGEFSNDAEGRPTFAFKLKGNWKPVLDTSKAAEKAKQEVQKKATEIIQNEGKKILEGIFKR